MLEVWDGLLRTSASLDFRLTCCLRLWNGLEGIEIGDSRFWGLGWVLESCATWREPLQLCTSGFSYLRYQFGLRPHSCMRLVLWCKAFFHCISTSVGSATHNKLYLAGTSTEAPQ